MSAGVRLALRFTAQTRQPREIEIGTGNGRGGIVGHLDHHQLGAQAA